MMCRCCGKDIIKPGRNNYQWCDQKKCQEHKVRLQRESKSGSRKEEYKSIPKARKKRHNGKTCQKCNARLYGPYRYHCPACLPLVDDYGMQANVCL